MHDSNRRRQINSTDESRGVFDVVVVFVVVTDSNDDLDVKDGKDADTSASRGIRVVSLSISKGICPAAAFVEAEPTPPTLTEAGLFRYALNVACKGGILLSKAMAKLFWLSSKRSISQSGNGVESDHSSMNAESISSKWNLA